MSSKEDHTLRLKAVYYVYQMGEDFCERAGNSERLHEALERGGLRHEDFTSLRGFLKAADKARFSDVRLEALFNDLSKDYRDAAKTAFKRADDQQGFEKFQEGFGTLEGFAGTIQALESTARNIIGMEYHKPLRESIDGFMTAIADGDHRKRREAWPTMVKAMTDYNFHALSMGKFYDNNRHNKPFSSSASRKAFEDELENLGEYVPKVSTREQHEKALEFSDSYMSLDQVFRKAFYIPLNDWEKKGKSEERLVRLFKHQVEDKDERFSRFADLVGHEVLDGLCDGVANDALTTHCIQGHPKYRQVSQVAQAIVKVGQGQDYTFDQSGLALFSPHSDEAHKAIEAARPGARSEKSAQPERGLDGPSI